MNWTSIEWVRNPDGSPGYTFNPITGCLNHVNGLCKGGGFPCYAYKLAHGRLKDRYLANPLTTVKEQNEATIEEYEEQRTDPFHPRFWPERLYLPFAGEPKGIFVCVSGDTKVSLSNGDAKRIKDIRLGDTIIGYMNGKAKSSKVTAIRETHSPEVYRLQVNGNELIGSPNHPILTPSGYKPFDKLNSGEYICMYEHTQKVDNENSQMRGSLNGFIRDRYSISGGSDRWRGDNICQENEAILSPNFRNSEFRRIAYQLANSDILAKASGGPEWKGGALLESSFNRFRDCSFSGGFRTLFDSQEVTISTCKKVYPSPNTTTLERTPFTRDDSNSPRYSDAQFSWCRVKAIERINKAEILYDIATTSHNFIANGIVVHNCDMGELFGDWVPREWQEDVFRIVKLHPDDRFYLLTKQPQNLAKWSPFPDNCWVGVTATNVTALHNACYYLSKIKATIKYLSLEPLLGWADDGANLGRLVAAGINWVIIGAQTKPYKPPRIEWVREIVGACNTAGISVFLKDNLKASPQFWNDQVLRQEVPDD